MSASVLSPCLRCGMHLPGIQCVPRNRSRCSRFLDYIGQLNRTGSHSILLKELKEFVAEPAPRSVAGPVEKHLSLAR